MLKHPLFLLVATVLVSGILGTGIWKIWDAQQDAIKDREARRTELGPVLAEYQRRVWSLSLADGELDYQLGPGPGINGHKLDRRDKVATAKFDRASEKAGREECDILAGGGSYVPSNPKFAGISMGSLGIEVQDLSGVTVFPIQGIQMTNILDIRAPVIWVFVRPLLPTMQRSNAGMELLYTSGELPLLRGQHQTPRMDRMVGNPDNFTPEMLATARRQYENDYRQLSNDISNRLTNAAAP